MDLRRMEAKVNQAVNTITPSACSGKRSYCFGCKITRVWGEICFLFRVHKYDKGPVHAGTLDCDLISRIRRTKGASRSWSSVAALEDLSLCWRIAIKAFTPGRKTGFFGPPGALWGALAVVDLARSIYKVWEEWSSKPTKPWTLSHLVHTVGNVRTVLIAKSLEFEQKLVSCFKVHKYDKFKVH